MERETADLNSLPQIEINYNDDRYPEKARKLKPHVFKDNDSYYCLYGPDPQVGIFGSGGTLLEAMEGWENDLEQRIARLAEGDTHGKEASHILNGEQ